MAGKQSDFGLGELGHAAPLHAWRETRSEPGSSQTRHLSTYYIQQGTVENQFYLSKNGISYWFQYGDLETLVVNLESLTI